MTYAASGQYLIGAVPVTYYTSLRVGSTPSGVYLDSEKYSNLVVDSTAVGDYLYLYRIVTGTNYLTAKLGSNTDMPTHLATYTWNPTTGATSDPVDHEITSETPSGFIDVLLSGNYTLTQR